ncbi:WG repeat-containing protein [Chitinophaga sp. Hz27]|uniref:WG repeat-containing protein n=1 Tax=Chitinophaga sp. Hz27 TaxID=3347169 RepID=UPI0035DE64CC
MISRKILFLLMLLSGVAACNFPKDKPLFIFTEHGKVGFIDQQGKIIIPPVYAEADDFSEGLAAVRSDGYFGYIDPSGKMIISAAYDRAEAFHNGMALVYKGTQAQYINKQGKLVFTSSYAKVDRFKNGYAQITTTTQMMGVIDSIGHLVVDTIYNHLLYYNKNLIFLHKAYENHRDSFGAINLNGKMVLPFSRFQLLEIAEKGYFIGQTYPVNNRTIYMLMDTTLHEIYRSDTSNYTLEAYSNGRIIATKRDSINHINYSQVIDTTGKIWYRDEGRIRPYKNNRAIVEKGEGENIVIDPYGHTIDTCYNIETYEFDYGVAFVQKSNNDEEEYWMIDTCGHRLGKHSFHSIKAVHLQGEYYEFSKGEFIGIVDKKGNIVVPAVFDSEYPVEIRDGIIKGKINNAIVYLNYDHKVVRATRPDPTKRPLNISEQRSGYTYVLSAGKELDLPPGFEPFPQPQPITAANNFRPGQLQIRVRTDTSILFEAKYLGYPLLIANTTTKPIDIDTQDSGLYLVLQAYYNNRWVDVEYLMDVICNDSYGTETLGPQQYWMTTCPQYTGSIKTDLRYKLANNVDSTTHTYIFSNVFKGSINPGQLWREKKHY